jgi:hypothetical protein
MIGNLEDSCWSTLLLEEALQQGVDSYRLQVMCKILRIILYIAPLYWVGCIIVSLVVSYPSVPYTLLASRT